MHTTTTPHRDHQFAPLPTAVVGLLLLCVFIVIWQLTHIPVGLKGLSLPQDDFFYYAKVAQNIATGHGSTFNGVVATNGYHPLWLAVLASFAYFNHSITFLLYVYAFLASASLVAVYFGARELLLAFSPRPQHTTLLSFAIAAPSWRALVSGLEIIITIPLLIWFLVALLRLPRPWSPLSGLLLGLIASLAILSRLDCGVLIVMLLVCDTFGTRSFWTLPKRVMAATCIGGIPVFSYLYLNHLWFHIWMPISGIVKDLHVRRGFSLLPSRYLVHFGLAIDVSVGVSCGGLFCLIYLWETLPRFQRSIAVAVLTFPFIHLALVSWRSDWPIWIWYTYTWIIALTFSLPLIVGALEKSHTGLRFSSLAFRFAIALICVYSVKGVIGLSLRHRLTAISTSVEGGTHIEAFAADHPGIYAMGDRAGVVSEMIGDPIVQTEGIMMDKRFMRHLQSQDDLLSVLRTYGVKYYIASVKPGVPYSPCLDAIEPAQAGPMAPHMRSTICGTPESISSNSDYTTLIYDLDDIDK